MSVEVTLHTDEAGQLFALAAGQPLAGPTPLAALPALQAGVYDEGRALAAALGGEQLLALLDDDPDGLLLLACDAKAEAVPWEFAALPGRQLLACRYGLLRLVDRDAPPPGNGGELQFVALAADPLVDEQGQPREGYRLKLEDELRAIRRALQDGDKALLGQRVPPTRRALRRALRRGPAVLHLTCHGDVVETDKAGEMAVLFLEDEDGGQDRLLGRDLVAMAPQGVLRLALLSACHTARGQANLARALVRGGLPAAIGMQAAFPDPLSDELARALYEYLLEGHPLGEALRQARQALEEKDPRAAGLPVGYAARGGWAPLPLAGGRPEVRRLGLPGACSLPQEVQPPRPILGRNGELHALARLYSRGAKVVTVVGTGGVGKTALAAAFAERFAWRWPRGVLGLSFAGGEVDAARFRGELLRGLLGEQDALGLAAAGPGEQARAILAALRDWDGLLLLDNYESVLQALAAGARDAGAEAGPPAAEEIDLAAMRALLRAAFVDDRELRRLCRETPALQGALPAFGSGFSLDHAIDALLDYCLTRDLVPELLAAVRKANPGQFARHFPGAARGAAADEAGAVHRLAYQVAEGGARLLLTSREHPAGLPGEVVFPGREPLPGLRTDPAAELFLKNSTRAGEQGPAGRRLAADIARETEGHPLAIALLAGEYDRSPVAAEAFLAGWPDELAAARREGLAGHHVTFAAAFNRSYDALPAALQARLRALSVYPFPFLAEGAAAVWGLEMDEGGLAAAGEDLGRLARANLLEVEAWFEDGTPATYRFQPALHQAVARRATDEERAGHLAGYAVYANWFVGFARQAVGRDPGIARLAQLGAEEFIKHITSQADDQLARYCWGLGTILQQFGRNEEAEQVLAHGAAHAKTFGDDVYRERILFQQARLLILQGDLDQALQRYEEAAALAQAEENPGEYGAILHQMALVYLTRGDLDRALALYRESLQLYEQLGDKKGKAASLHEMAEVYLTRGDLDRALALYQESLQLKEQLGDKQGKAASLHQMAEVYLTRGDLDRALALYQESLQLKEQLGDKQGKAASLANMARVYLTRGDLDRALALYQESLQLLEQLGDKKGKAASLHNMANIFMARGEWVEAERALQDSLRLAQGVGSVEHVAFAAGKLGQVAEARGDGSTALAHYREALAIFEQLGMPEAQQVRRMIAHLEGGGAPADDPLGQAIDRARGAAARGDVASAIAAQEEAVALARQAGGGHEALVTLSVQLYNLAAYYRQAGRFDDAVRALEEVVALDERTGHQDLESDRQALAEARRLAAMPPEERERERPQGGPQAGALPIDAEELPPELREQLEAFAEQLARLSPEERAEVEGQMLAFARQLEAMSPEERANLQAAAQAAARRDQIESLADQAKDAGIAALRGEVEPGPLAQQLEEVAAQAADGEEPGSPWDELAGYLRAVAALLRG
ncbi:MAG: tetratricopeptide repeat protein, partial [Anaerolineae bacterium]|nr:tetratricopeptide repeat protein [Anaerolineae bacterium]